MLILNSEKNLSEIGDIWQKIWIQLSPKYPFLCWVWQKTWWDIFPQGKLLIYVLYEDDKAVGFALFKKNENILSWASGEEVSDYLDLVCQDKYKETFWEQIFDRLKRDNISSVVLRNLPEKSISRKILIDLAYKYKLSATEEKEDVVPKIVLPKKFESYLESLSRKNRHELRRKARRFENEAVNWQLVKTSLKNHHTDCQSFFEFFRQDGTEKRKFLTKPMEDFICQGTFELQKFGLLDLSSLVVNKEILAQTLAFSVDKTYFLYNMVVNPKFYHLSPGIIINKLLIEESINKGREVYDFMQGNERYKYQFGAEDEFVYKITIKFN